jgi:hypothetical protein
MLGVAAAAMPRRKCRSCSGKAIRTALLGAMLEKRCHMPLAVLFKPDDDLIVVRFGESLQLLHSTLYKAVK